MTTITITVSSRDTNGNIRVSLTWSGIQVRPTATTPLASGNITKSGTANIANVSGSTNFGTLTKVAGATNKLVFTTSPVTAYVGIASSSITVQRQDQYGNPNTADPSLPVTLSSDSGGPVTFTPASPITITTGSSSASFTYTDTQIGTPTITAASTSPAMSVTQKETVLAAPLMSKFVIIGSTTQVAGASQSLTITAKDTIGNTVTTYTGSHSLTFSGANSSTNPITAPTVKPSSGTAVPFGQPTSINFTNGVATVSGSNNGVMILYKAETAPVCVTDGTYSSTGSDCLSVVVSPATVNKLAFTTDPVSIAAGTPSGTISVQRQDRYGNPVTAEAARTVDLTSDSSGTVTFNPASPLTIATGSHSANFTYTDTLGGSPTITAASSSPNKITSATQVETITVGTATVTTEPATGVRRTSAILNSIVNAAGNSVTLTFEYGTTISYGLTATYPLNPITGSKTVNLQLPGLLTPSTLYHYRAVGMVAGNPTPIYGVDRTFTTLAAGSIDYYVDNTNPSASDSNSGTTPALPFSTIFKGANVADAGDTVHVLGGTYAETVKPSFNGGSGMPLTFKAEAPVTVTGMPIDPVNHTEMTSGGAFRLYSKGYIVIDGFTITGTADYGMIATSCQYLTFKNNHVSNSGSSPNNLRSGIYLTGTTNSYLIGNTTDHNTSDGIRLNKSSNNNWIESNVSFGNATQISNQATGINLLLNSNNNTVIRNTTYGNEDTGLNFYTGSSHNIVVNNLTYGNGDHGIDNNAAPYNTFIGNTVHGNVTVGINLEEDLSGSGSGGATLRNNIFSDNGYLKLVGGGTLVGHSPGNIRVDATSVSSPAATTIDYDLIYSSPAYSGTQIIWGGTNYASLVAFQTTGQEAHGLQANPLFTSPAPIAEQPPAAPFNVTVNVGNYLILPGSPAIDSANSDAPNEQTVDIAGNPRYDDPNTTNTGVGTRTFDDRGAYEFQPLLISQAIAITAPLPFPTSAVFNSSFTTSATGGGSGNPVSIVGSGSCSGNGSDSVLITITSGTGDCTVTLNQAGNADYYNAPTLTKTVAAAKITQTITVTGPVPFPTSAVYNTSFTVSGTGGGSGNPVTITGSGSCSGSSDGSALITMTSGIGICTVNFNQNGNDFYSAAVDSRTITAEKAIQTITITAPIPFPTSAIFNTSLTATAIGGDSGNPVSIVGSGSCSGSGNDGSALITMSSQVGNCTVTFSQNATDNYSAATVSKIIAVLEKLLINYLPLVIR